MALAIYHLNFLSEEESHNYHSNLNMNMFNVLGRILRLYPRSLLPCVRNLLLNVGGTYEYDGIVAPLILLRHVRSIIAD